MWNSTTAFGGSRSLKATWLRRYLSKRVFALPSYPLRIIATASSMRPEPEKKNASPLHTSWASTNPTRPGRANQPVSQALTITPPVTAMSSGRNVCKLRSTR